jgi:3,4-dihydroxy-2-butanone 4-phosphate synthase
MAAVAVISLGNVNAHAPAKLITETAVVNSDNWVTVQNENGIKVLFLEFELEGETYLKIQFENTTNKAVEFLWSLSNKSGTIVITEDEMHEIKTQINSMSSKIYGDVTLFPINKGESFKDFSVAINIK